LEPNPQRRYTTAREALADLRTTRPWGTRAWRLRLRRRAAGALLVLAALGTIAIGAWELAARRPWSRFSHVAPLSPTGIAGIGKDGERLWTIPGVEPRTFLALLRRGSWRRPVLAALLNPPGEYEPRIMRTLALLDSETGKVQRQIELPSAAASFPGFADWFSAALRAVDLDGDGWDELVLAYHHASLWPCWVVLYEPRFDRSRILLVASGHHRFARAEDLDGDGRPELLFTGISNRMGWYQSVAAVKVLPWIGESRTGQDRLEDGSSPDESYTYGDALLWYALVGRAGGDLKLGVDRQRRRLTMEGNSRVSPVELSFAGFRTSDRSALPDGERQTRRVEAYRHFREVTRLLQAGLPGEALAECETARELARQAGDALLGEWLARVRGRALAAEGRTADAETLFTQLAATSVAASDIAFDAGRAFHLTGDRERALAWYRRGLARGGGNEAGRGRYEYLQGIALLLGEAHRWREGIAELDRYLILFPRELTLPIYREYLRWRSGEKPSLADFGSSRLGPDLERYWVLEFRQALGDDPAGLLRDLDHEAGRASETRSLLPSLRSELLARLGRSQEALEVARYAFRRARQELATEPITRAHFELLAERLAHRARAAGFYEEAATAERELLDWKHSTSGASHAPARRPLR
jgi:hypothetical protein